MSYLKHFPQDCCLLRIIFRHTILNGNSIYAQYGLIYTEILKAFPARASHQTLIMFSQIPGSKINLVALVIT